MKNIKKQNKGITLIVLVITIVVLIILASISIGSLLGSKGIISQSNFSVYGSKIRDYQRELEEYIATEQAINDKEDVIIYTSDKDEIKSIITSMSDEDAEKFVIQNNELKYNPDNVDDKEKDWLAELGILAMEAIFAIVFMSGDKVYKTIYSNKVEFPTINPTSSAGGFSGWFYDEEGTTQANVGDELTENITLYAKWEEMHYTITYMVNGTIYDEIRANKITFPEKEPITDTQEFAGWYYDQELNNKATDGEKIIQNITLYAKMNDLQKYTITFYDRYTDRGTTLFDTIESCRALPTEKVPSDKLEWTCGCKAHNVRLTFVGWIYYTQGSSNYIYYQEGDVLNGNIIAEADYKQDYGDIQGIVNACYEYDQGSGHYTPGEIPANMNPAPEKVTILNGTYKNEKIVSVEIENMHCSKQMNYYYDPAELSWQTDSPIFCDFLTINNTGDLILTRQPLPNEGITNEEMGYRYYIHYITQITTETGRKERVLINVRYEVTGFWYCLAEGTKITLANHTTKNIEDITYEDELLVWDFDNGCFATAKPLWIKKKQVAEEYNLIKFDNGVELKTVIDHRIFNMESQKFTYTMNEEDTPIGTTTFLEDGTTAKLVERKVVKEAVNYYNVITDYHINLFANGILTSCRLNNLYKIENMKFVKDNRILAKREEFKNILDKYFYGLRLAEQPKEINRGNDAKHTNTLEEYVKRLELLKK